MSETFVTVYQGNGGRIDLGYEYTQDYATNKTSLTVKAYAVKTNASYYSYRSSPQTFTLTVNGIATTYGWTFNFSNMTLNARYLITTAVRELTHNPDGGVANIGASVYCATGTDGLGTINGSTSIVIPTIPRTSIATLNTATQAVGGVIRINTNRASTGFGHAIYSDFFDGFWTRIDPAGVTDYFDWNLPTSFANKIPNTDSGGGRILVETYSGATYIGAVILNFTATVPNTAPYQPTITGLTAGISGSGRDKTISKYVQNVSKAASSFSPNPQGGAGISSSSINIKRQSDNGNSMTISGASGTSDVLTLSGVYVITATTTDTRGRSKTATITITVEAYTVPKITSFSAVRQASAKTSVDTVRNGTYTYMGGSNPLSVIVARAPRGGAFVDLNTTAGTTAGTFFGTYVSTGNSEASSYDFRLTISDSFGNSATATLSISTSAVALTIKRDTGIGVGKIWEQGALDVGGDQYISGNIISRGVAVALEKLAYSYSNGILIDLAPASWLNTMYAIEIRGNGYGASIPIDTIIQFYHYDPIGTIINSSQINFGNSLGTARIFLDGGRIKCWIAQGSSYQTFKVRAYTNGGVLNDITLSNVAEPTGTNKVTCPAYNAWNTANFNPASYSLASHSHTLASLGADAPIVSSSNGNGFYVKYGDGTAIAYQIINPAFSIAAGGYYTSGQYAFPISFVGTVATMIQGYVTDGGGGAFYVHMIPHWNGSWQYMIVNNSPTTMTRIVTGKLIAIGRWK